MESKLSIDAEWEVRDVISDPQVLQPIEGLDLQDDCWPHFYLFANRSERLSSKLMGDV